jgi:hypothetical protein
MLRAYGMWLWQDWQMKKVKRAGGTPACPGRQALRKAG